MSRTLRKAVALGTALLLTMSLVLPALAADPVTGSNTSIQTATNTGVISQSVVAISGDATAGKGGAATSGDVSAKASADQSQSNVQVIVNAAVAVGPTATMVAVTTTPVPTTATATNTSDQLATNVAEIDQSAAATSGNAVAEVSATATPKAGESLVTGKASATTGDVSVQLSAAQSQENVQVVVNAAVPLWSLGSVTDATSDKTQTASNAALTDQTGVGISGNATATGLATPKTTSIESASIPEKVNSAEAKSGNVTVAALAEQEQLNVQVAANAAVTAFSPDAVATATDTSLQAADNLACITQDLVGISGNATATGNAKEGKEKEKEQTKATTGNVVVEAFAEQEQLNVQVDANAAVAINSPEPDRDFDTVANATNDVTQMASNTAVITQSLAGISGDATATTSEKDGKEKEKEQTEATTGNVSVAAAAFQSQANLQIALNAAVLVDSPEGIATATNRSFQDASNQAFIDQVEAGFSGFATATGEGASAKTGNVALTAAAEQEQLNVQAVANVAVIVGSAFGVAVATNDSLQNASNLAVIAQDLVGVSGDATATGNAKEGKEKEKEKEQTKATSGNVTATARAEQEQANAQLVVNAAVLVDSPNGTAVADTVSLQEASNEARASQVETAISGDATATGPGSTAKTGNVMAFATAFQRQLNVQAAINAAVLIETLRGAATATNDSIQIAANLGKVNQVVLGLSGAAEARGLLSLATSGNVLAGASLGLQAERNLQLIANVALLLGNVLGFADSTNLADQIATANLLGCQQAAAESGPALATGERAETTTGDSESTAEVGKQKDKNDQFLVQFNGEIGGPSDLSGLLALLPQ